MDLLKYKRSEFLKHNIILFVSLTLLNFFTFLYHLYVARKLGPSEYGALGALLALTYFMNVPFNSIQAIITKVTSTLLAKQEVKKINFFTEFLLKKFLFFGLIVSFLFIILTPIISNYIKVHYGLLLILSIYLLLSLLIPITRGLLQGVQNFKSLSGSYITEGASRILFVVLLVSLGLGIWGAILSLTLSYLLVFVMSIFFIRRYLNKEKEKFTYQIFNRYSIFVFLAVLTTTIFYNIDLILVKHFFSDLDAGYYSAISFAAKIIFFASSSIYLVMMPKVSDNFERHLNYKKPFYYSLILTLLISSPIAAFYFIFPEFTINFLFGKAYLAVSNLLGWFGLIMVIFSIINLFVMYNLSINRIKFVYILIFFNLLEVVALYLFHNSLIQVIETILFIMLLLLIIIVAYTFKKDETIYNNTSL